MEHKRRCLNNVGIQTALVIISDDTIVLFVWMIPLTVWYEQLFSVAFVVRYIPCEICKDIVVFLYMCFYRFSCIHINPAIHYQARQLLAYRIKNEQCCFVRTRIENQFRTLKSSAMAHSVRAHTLNTKLLLWLMRTVNYVNKSFF